VQVHLVAVSTTDAFHWFTGWMPSIGLDNVKAAIKSHAVSGPLRVQLAMQVASTRPDDPGSPTKLGSALDGDGEACTGMVSVADTTDDTYFVRFGVAYALQPGQSGLAQGDVTLVLSYTQCGKVAGGKALSLASSTSTDAYVAVTSMIPAILVQKVKAMVVARSLNGNFEWKLCYRTATTSTQNPSGWTALEANYHGAGEFCIPDTAVSLDSVMWVQLGVLYHSSSGAGDAQLDVSFSVRRC